MTETFNRTFSLLTAVALGIFLVLNYQNVAGLASSLTSDAVGYVNGIGRGQAYTPPASSGSRS